MNRSPPATLLWNSACSLMAFPISVSATPSPTRSVISRSSCRRTRCFIRSPTCRRHLRHPPPLVVPARQRPPPDFRCSQILRSSQFRICSPCSGLLPYLAPQSRSRQHRCSPRHWLHLPKASLRRCQPLALLSHPVVQRRLDFLLPQHPPNLRRLQLQQHSPPPRHSQRHLFPRNLSNPLPERFTHSVHPPRHLGLNQRLRRMHLCSERRNRSILSPLPPQVRCQAKGLRNQGLAAPSCWVRLPRHNIPPLLLHPRPRSSQFPACLPPRPLLSSSPHLPSLQPWKKFLLSPRLRLLRHSLPHVDCSAPHR